jgi:hypothetical protein
VPFFIDDGNGHIMQGVQGLKVAPASGLLIQDIGDGTDFLYPDPSRVVHSAIPVVTSQLVSFDDVSPVALSLGPLLEGHVYLIMFEEVTVNDDTFALAIQRVGDATTVVGLYNDDDDTVPSTVTREFLTFDIAPTVGLNAAPYVVVRVGQGPVPLDITPGLSQSTGQTRVMLLDWNFGWIG